MPMIPFLVLMLMAPILQTGGAKPASSDWCTTGWDCTLFAAADVNGDGFDDVITVNGSRHLCAAITVGGWKSAPWEVILEPVPEGAVALAALRSRERKGGDEIAVVFADRVEIHSGYDNDRLRQSRTVKAPADVKLSRVEVALNATYVRDGAGSPWTIEGEQLIRAAMPLNPVAPIELTAPPFEPQAALLMTFAGDFNGDGLADSLGVFSASLPHQHRVVRLALRPNPASSDQDSDGLSDEKERELGTDPYDRDTDDDGLLDGWEVPAENGGTGLPRGVPGPQTPLNPLRQDVIVAVAPYEGTEVAAMRASIERSKAIYARINNHNPDGSTGIRLQYRIDAVVPTADFGHWHDCATKHFPAMHRGLMHWMQVSGLGGGGQAQQLGDEGGSGANWAAFAHELGHQLSLSHTGDSAPPWCPLYPSIMNYAFNYSLGGDGNAIQFSPGRFTSVELRENALDEHLPFPIAELKYLSTGPFSFTLEDDGAGGTRIDWNQNGVFDTSPVQADINYGGSTNCGERRNHGKIGAGPALTRVGQTIYMATLDQIQSRLSLQTYLGDEKWSDSRPVPNSATQFEPVLAGGGGGGSKHGCLLWRRSDGWRAVRFDADTISPPAMVPGLPFIDMAGEEVNGRILLVGRRDDDSLPAWWLDISAAADGKIEARLTPGPLLDFTSQVPVDFDIDPASGHLVMAGSAKNPKGREQCLKVAWFQLTDDGNLTKVEQRWAGGDAAGWNCTTRPVVRYTDAGELYIFHTGWPDGEGQMTAWRTRQIANRTLADGWLLCMLYDIWTRTRRPVAFETGPQGAVFAFRWDSGKAAYDTNDLLIGHNGLGIDPEPMRDYDDGAKISLWGIRHSILNMRREK